MRKLILLIAIFTSSLCYGNWTKISSKDFPLLPPPQIDSVEYKQDFQVLLDYEQSRSQEQCELARKQLTPGYSEMFFKSGPLTESEAIKARNLTQKAMALAERVSKYYKNKFRRPRPYSVEKGIHPCISKPGGSTSYPSSHAAKAAMGACVLAEIYPSKAPDILSYGSYLGDLRVIVGVHHPSDVRAGQLLAQRICDHLLSLTDFQNELDQLKH